MIIDFHTHCFNDALAPKAMANLSKNSLYPPHYDGTLRGLRERMAEAGISHSCILNIATNAHQTPKVNDWAISLVGESDVIPFGSVHPDSDWRGELARLAAAGVKGVKFHPDYQGFFADDARMFPIYETALQYGFILIFHCGKDLVLREPLHCGPERFLHVAEAFPGKPVIGAHLGAQGLWDDMFRLLIGKDVYLDTSFGFKFLSQTQIDRILAEHDTDKLLFATDAPWQRQSVEVAEMRQFVHDPIVSEKIFYGNAARLLGLS